MVKRGHAAQDPRRMACRHALVQRDASGLIALLRAVRPTGMAGATQGPAASAVAAAAAAVAAPALSKTRCFAVVVILSRTLLA